MCVIPVRIFFEKYLLWTTCTGPVLRTTVQATSTCICSTTINIHVVQVVVPYRVPGGTCNLKKKTHIKKWRTVEGLVHLSLLSPHVLVYNMYVYYNAPRCSILSRHTRTPPCSNVNGNYTFDYLFHSNLCFDLLCHIFH